MNANVEIQEIVAKSLENMAKSLAKRCVADMCKRHGLNEEEEIENLGLKDMKVMKKAMREEKVDTWLPFNKQSVNRECCQGLSYNKGLFTQCMKRKEDGDYCKSCSKSKCGTVAERMEASLYEFRDNKGRKPVRYAKYLEKCGKSVEEAKEEARAKGLEIDEEHLSEAKKAKKEKKEKKEQQRGRPKKSKVESEEVTDLFAKMTLDASGSTSVTEEAVVKEEAVVEEEDDYSSTGTRLLEEAKKERKQNAEKLAQQKAEKEAKMAQQKAEKEAKLAQQKADKEAAKAAKEAEKEVAKAAKEAEKAAKEAAKAAKAPKKSETKVVAAAEEEKPKKVSVTRIKIDEVEYLKSGENILYNPETKEAVGVWDPIEKKISELPEDDEEEEEEEYDE